MLSRKINLQISLLTIGIILSVWFMGESLFGFSSWISIALIVLLGIPHGATDHILFRHIHKDFGKGYLYRFLARYLMLMGLLILTWWILPGLALMIFLAVSAYHFGQSNWSYLKVNTTYKKILYNVWGAFILGALLLWNYSEVEPIISSLIGTELYIPNTYQSFIPLAILFLLVCLTLHLYYYNKINGYVLLHETSTLILLSLLFKFTPLLVGFAVYFVLWHSTISIKDQIEHFRNYSPNYSLRDFISQSIPFSLVAFMGIGLFSYFSSAELMSEEWLGQFFIMISIVTLPHSLLMDSLLENPAKEVKTSSKHVEETKQQKNKKSLTISVKTYNQSLSNYY